MTRSAMTLLFQASRVSVVVELCGGWHYGTSWILLAFFAFFASFVLSESGEEIE